MTNAGMFQSNFHPQKGTKAERNSVGPGFDGVGSQDPTKKGGIQLLVRPMQPKFLSKELEEFVETTKAILAVEEANIDISTISLEFMG